MERECKKIQYIKLERGNRRTVWHICFLDYTQTLCNCASISDEFRWAAKNPRVIISKEKPMGRICETCMRRYTDGYKTKCDI